MQNRWPLKNHLQKVALALCAGVIILLCTKFLNENPLNFSIWIGVILMCLITLKNLRFGLGIILFLPIIGELIRLPYGGENGILISDIAMGILMSFWIIHKIVPSKINNYHQEKSTTSQNQFFKPIIGFIAIAIFSLLQALLFLSPNEILKSSLYLIRFIEYSSLIFIVPDIIKSTIDQHKTVFKTFIATTLIALAGFIQLLIYPNLNKLEEFGWDPHMNRLVSTWLDPNFIGGFLAFMIAITMGILVFSQKWRSKIILGAISAFWLIALFLTYSRSGYIAAIIVIFIIGIIKSRKILAIALIIGLLGVSVSQRAQQRLDDLIRSATTIIYTTADTPDPTAKLRILSWQQTFELIGKNPLFGSGYNTLRYVKLNAGHINSTQTHSASGSDSSFLTILATTGIFGLIPFIWFYLQLLFSSIKIWRTKSSKITPHWRGFSLGLFAGTLGLIGHSFFVNSLLFPQIMIYLFTFTGILAGLNKTLKD